MRSSPQLSAFPALGRDVSIDYRTHPKDLSAQKLSLSAPLLPLLTYSYHNLHTIARDVNQMDLGIVAALVMLVVWGVGTFALNDAPGWLHLLLTLGVFTLIWRIVVLGTGSARKK